MALADHLSQCARSQSLGQRRKRANDQRKQALAQQVHPRERVPRFLAQFDVGETARLEIHRHEVAVDRVVRGQRVGVEAPECDQPALCEGDPRGPTLLRPIRPGAVVAVVADGRGGDRLKLDVLVEECREAALEFGHPRSLGAGGVARAEGWRGVPGGRPTGATIRACHRPGSRP